MSVVHSVQVLAARWSRVCGVEWVDGCRPLRLQICNVSTAERITYAIKVRFLKSCLYVTCLAWGGGLSSVSTASYPTGYCLLTVEPLSITLSYHYLFLVILGLFLSLFPPSGHCALVSCAYN